MTMVIRFELRIKDQIAHSKKYHKYITNIPQIYHKYTTNIPQIYHKYTTNIPQIYHKYTTNIPQIYHKSTAKCDIVPQNRVFYYKM